MFDDVDPKKFINLVRLLTILYLFKQLAMISMGTVPFPSSACLAVKAVVALLVEDAVIMVLLQGEPFAIWVSVAFLNASFKSWDVKGIYDVALALETAVTLSGRTPVIF